MNKEEIIEILEDYEFFVDDDFGGHYEHINCSQRALTPLGIVNILDYIDDLEQQVKKQKEVIDKANKYLHTRGIQKCYNGRHYRGLDGLQVQVLEDILKEVSE